MREPDCVAQMVACEKGTPRHFLGRYLRFLQAISARDVSLRAATQWKAEGAVELQLMSGGIVSPSESVDLSDWIGSWE